MLAFIYVAIGVLFVAIGVGLYLYRRPLEWYDRYLQHTMGRTFDWPGPEEWHEFQEKGQSFVIRFIMPGLIALFGLMLILASASSI